ncbi:MAG: Na+/H+ antiporter NhaA [Thermoleophilaceae bacterium]
MNAVPAFRGRTAWARNLAAPVRAFLGNQTGSAAFLLIATVAALLWANSPWPGSYDSAWGTKLSIQIGTAGISLDLRHWVNEGLMTFFFLVVGLEAKRELDMGELRERRRITIPVAAAIGGATVPVLIYLAFNGGGSGAHGWGAAMSTDTAFALGALALLAPGATRLRVFLLTLSVVDDLVALLVIATVYTDRVSAVPLAIAGALFALLFALAYAPVAWRRPVAAAVGAALWVALLESGIDPVIAGLAVGLITSAYTPARMELERVTELTRSFREQPTAQLARHAQLGVASAISPNERLQYRLQPWTSYVFVPLFALANAGVHISHGLLSEAVGSPITLGIVCGYVLGKPLGILGASWLASQRRIGGLRRTLSWPVLTAGGVVSGIGLTVSLLISSIAFSGRALDDAKVGILTAAVVATAGTWVVMRVVRALPAAVRARQISGTADVLLDLSDEVDSTRDHVRGSDDAPVTLVEYGDYQCSYCGQAEVVIRELLDSFGDDLRYAWRHLPLNDVHEHAQVAAEAVEAAAEQGAFWAMHDRLLKSQGELLAPDLRRHAEALDLDVDRFWRGVRNRDFADRVAEDVASADLSGVAGTPTFFINGRRHYGSYDVATLTTSVRAARARSMAERAARAKPVAEMVP